MNRGNGVFETLPKNAKRAPSRFLEEVGYLQFWDLNIFEITSRYKQLFAVFSS